MNDLEIPVKIQISSPLFIKRFKRIYLERTGSKYHMGDANYFRLGVAIQNNILDYLIERYPFDKNKQYDEMEEFISWFFDTQNETNWRLHLVKSYFAKWAHLTNVRKQQSQKEQTQKVQSNRNEEIQFARYLGEGYFDAQLTKKQFWIGVKWRSRHLNEEQLLELQHWQIENYDIKTRQKLKRWKTEYYENEFNGKEITRMFFFELVKSKEQKLLNWLKESGHRDLYKYFTTEELKS